MNAPDPAITDAAALLGGVASELLLLAAFAALAAVVRLQLSRR